MKGNPAIWDYFGSRESDADIPVQKHVYAGGWTIGTTYRSDMIRDGDLVALWITGSIDPEIYEFGWVDGGPYHAPEFDTKHAVDQRKANRPARAIGFNMVRMWDNYVPREEMKADAVLAGAEQFRAAQGSNPSYLDHEQTKALASLLSHRVSSAELKAARWSHLV